MIASGRTSGKYWLLLCAGGLAAGLLIFLAVDPGGGHEPGADIAGIGVESRQLQSSAAPAGDANPHGTEPAELLLGGELQRFLAALAGGPPPQAETLRMLRRLKRLVHESEPNRAAEILIELLRRGEDAATGLPFTIGPDGVLDAAPTWRAALLDFLGQTDPWLALPFSRGILAATASADEYALALRNLGWMNIDGSMDAEIAAAFSAMLDRPEWLANPPRGFLEAFDLAVHVGGAAMALELGGLIESFPAGSGPDPVNFAAFLALDRMMQRQPSVILGILAQDPGWLDWAPRPRAALMARLDVRDQIQRQAILDYLRRTDLAPVEREAFVTRFPDRSTPQGYRLVTAWEDVSRQRGLDTATLAQLAAWRDDSQFADIDSDLAAIEARLRHLTGR